MAKANVAKGTSDGHLAAAAGEVGDLPKRAIFRTCRIQSPRKTESDGSFCRPRLMTNLPLPILGRITATILLIFGIQFGMRSGAYAEDFTWAQSLPIQFKSTNSGPFRGTETRALVFFEGKLYAAIGDW